MWVVEVNVKGHRFTHQILGARRLRDAAHHAADHLHRLRRPRIIA